MKKQNSFIVVTTGFTLSLFLSVGCSKNQSLNNETSDSAYAQQTTGIIGGSAVESTDVIAQSTVAIFNVKNGGLCTGTLITENMIVTASHCTSENPFDLVVYFSKDLPKDGHADSKKIRQVIAGRTSPLWAKQKPDQRSNWGDIAVLRFAGSPPEGYKRAELLVNAGSIKAGDSVVVAGFGVTNGPKQTSSDELRKTSLNILGSYSATELLLDESKGHGSCQGDSGGPAFIEQDGKLKLLAVVSRGPKDCNQFGFYTLVIPYLKWLVKTVDDLNKVTKVEKIAQPPAQRTPSQKK